MGLPPGTVTFLFTDIQGSTGLWEQYPEAMQLALSKHDAILRNAIERNYGTIVKTTGDGVHAVFETSKGGVTAALEAQGALLTEAWEGLPPAALRVRMGLYTGEAEIRGGDYYGGALNRAERLMSLAGGGQILISHATAELLRESLPAGASLRDLGEISLKGLTRSEHVYQLLHPSLPSEFPQLPSLETVPNNLPIQVTTFIGREKEIDEISSLLNTSRLITLTGSGGTGKTRLSQEIGTQLLAQFPQGVWLVELAPLSEPSQVIPAMAQLFRLPETGSSPLRAILIEYLRQKKALLILDNCEHLIDECARLADDLLHHCPQLKILASSREALGISGEIAYRIPSLAPSEAVRLFVERASSANSRFRLTEENSAAITRICARLDGIPLAIELAAARARLLAPEQIAARLDDRFRLLIGGSRTALPRQQTLRALIDWSYALLSEPERGLLQVTSVFNGGWTLDALLAVSGDDEAETLEWLEQLVNKSLVVVDESGKTMRYALLETIRQYAREKLLDAGPAEISMVRNCHMQYYTTLVEAMGPRFFGSEMVEALNELEIEQDNLRAALEWAYDHDPQAMLRMTSNLSTFWGRRALAAEGLSWIKQSLERAESLPIEEQAAEIFLLRDKARALLGQGELALELGENSPALEAISASIDLARHIDDQQLLARALCMGAIIAGFRGMVEQARPWMEEAYAISSQFGYAYELAMAIDARVFMDVITGQPVDPGRLDEVIRVARASRSPYTLGMAISNVGRLETHFGHFDRAIAHYEEACTLFHQMGDSFMLVSLRSETGHAYRMQGRYSQAMALYRETIQAFREFGQLPAVAHELECMAFIAVMQDQGERAARLLGAAEVLRETLGSEMMMKERQEYDDALARLRTQVSEEILASAWADGRTMDIHQAIAYAVE